MDVMTRGAAGGDFNAEAFPEDLPVWYLSRAYEDHLDWLENQPAPPSPPPRLPYDPPMRGLLRRWFAGLIR
jgi:hypothetical protein